MTLRGPRIVVLAALAAVLAGCDAGIPSASNPTCSWATTPPGDADTLCREAYSTLSAVTMAAVRGEAASVRRMVTNPAVAARIIAYGKRLRSEGNASSVHVVPSLVLNTTDLGLGVLVYLRGHAGNTKVVDEETVYLSMKNGRATITADTPKQDW